MKRAMLILVMTTAVAAIGRAAQAPPNLGGTWRPQNPMSGQVNPFELTITQTADSVTIRTPLGNPESVTISTPWMPARGSFCGGRHWRAACMAAAQLPTLSGAGSTSR
jgi:hypothetical protein